MLGHRSVLLCGVHGVTMMLCTSQCSVALNAFSLLVILVMLQAPRVPVQAEDLEMQKLINTYGKTFHTWQVDRGDVLPFGKHALALVLCLPPPPAPTPPRRWQPLSCWDHGC